MTNQNDFRHFTWRGFLWLCMLCGIGSVSSVYADTNSDKDFSTSLVQQQNVTGTVTDESGLPLPGVSITVKNTSRGVSTDFDGKYSIAASQGEVLVFSYVGYATQEKVVGGGKNLTINVLLKEEAQQLEDVVVTALGIKRSEKALSYNVQQVGSDELTNVKDANFMNSLAGKVAGVNINASSSGIGGATRVVMRGPKSIQGGNQALYVIDGIPMFNSNKGATSGKYASQPGGEGISDINPDDIAEMTVLSGPAAAALYGSAAAQGVIMITTKKGKEGKISVLISNSTSFSNPFIMPEFQQSYVNKAGEFASWGEKTSSIYGGYNPKDFFNTGANVQNTVALTVGSEKNQTYLSVGTTNANGIIPNSEYDRYNFTSRNTTSFLKDKMILDVGFSYVKQNDQNLIAQGQFFNPLTSLYMFPRGENFDAVRTYELWDLARGLYTQNWTWGNTLNMQNPYWIVNRMVRTNQRDRYMANVSLKYEILSWLDLTGRVRYDHTALGSEDKRYASTIPLFTSGSQYGFYATTNGNEKAIYTDFMANINKTFAEKYSVSANIGVSRNYEETNSLGIQGGLKAPSNVFMPYALDYGKATQDNHPIYSLSKHLTNSVFASAEFGYDRMLYLTLTGRNDWDSALSNTRNLSFFYPSVGMSGIISEMTQMPTWIDFLKVRGSWASVGSAIPRNISSPWRYGYNTGTQTYDAVSYLFPENFYPERTDSWEAGLSAKLFKNALTIEATLYRSFTKNQTLNTGISPSAGFSNEYVQTGKVRNQGVELSIGYNHTLGELYWNTTLTYSMNQNKIIDLLPDENQIVGVGGFDGAGIFLKKGGTMGDLYSMNVLARDPEGNIALNDQNGVIKIQLPTDRGQYLGTVLPSGNIGWRNDFNYKGLNVGFMFSARLGGVVISSTQAMLDQVGVTKATADARDNGGIPVNKGTVDAQSFYQTVGGESAVWSEYTYDGTNVRLQEVYIGYTLPSQWFNDKVKVNVAVTGRNQWMIYNKAPFDPELTASTGTYYQGFDYFMQPSLRNYGFNVKLQF